MVKTEGGRSSPAGNAGSGRHPWGEEDLPASVLVPWSGGGVEDRGGGVERRGRARLRVRGRVGRWRAAGAELRKAES